MDFNDLKDEYARMFDTAVLTMPDAVASVVKQIFDDARYSIYKILEEKTGVPAYFIGTLHYREASFNFNAHLHNGDSLLKRTVHVPAGRIPGIEPPYTWIESATDALELKGLPSWKDWSPAGISYKAELYNGMGYRNQGFVSPYLWSGTQHYTGGLFPRDHVFDENARDPRPGVMALIRHMVNEDLIKGIKTAKPIYRIEQALKAHNRESLRLQKLLKTEKFYKGKLDGDWGTQSREAKLDYMKMYHPEEFEK